MIRSDANFAAKGALPLSRERLEALYRRYNRRERATRDPVQFLYRYHDIRDREIVGIVAAVLAYGRVEGICASVSRVLATMPSPSAFVRGFSKASLRRVFSGFRHRFTTGDDLAALLYGVGRIIEQHGSLEMCLAAHLRDEDDTVLPALSKFVERIRACGGRLHAGLLPSPSSGSACKRPNLFLRWMVRRDEVDPGGWEAIPPSKLVIPLDTHMFRICSGLGLTRRRSADLHAALEITGEFRKIAPDDPLRYDFSLTHAGISGERIRLKRRAG